MSDLNLTVYNTEAFGGSSSAVNGYGGAIVFSGSTIQAVTCAPTLTPQPVIAHASLVLVSSCNPALAVRPTVVSSGYLFGAVFVDPALLPRCQFKLADNEPMEVFGSLAPRIVTKVFNALSLTCQVDYFVNGYDLARDPAPADRQISIPLVDRTSYVSSVN